VGEDDTQTVEVATLLASEAIAAGGICAMYGNECWLALVEAHLSDAGFDVPALRAEGHIVLASSEGAVHGNHGPAEAVVDFDSQAAGPRRRTTVLHVASIISRDDADLADHEALLAATSAASSDHVICLYDRESFDSAAIKRAIHAHALVVVDGQLHVNHHFVPPGAEPLTHPDAAVEDLIASLDVPADAPGARSLPTGPHFASKATAAALASELARRAHTERQLRESEKLYRALFEMSPDSVLVHSEGQVVFANRAAAAMVGMPFPEAITGTPIARFVHLDSASSVADRVRWMYATGQAAPPTEERFVRADGTAFHADVLAAPIMFQGKPAIQVIMHDITARKQAADDLQFRSFLLDRATDSIVVQDAETGAALYVNEAACALRGYSREELLARDARDWIPRDHPYKSLKRQQKLLEDKQMIYENEISRRDGTVVPVEVHASVIEYENRTVIVSVARDVTERRLAALTIQNMAYFDSLTKLANRTLFLDRLGIAVAQAHRTGTGVAVMFLDLDHFKPVNDTLGHVVGDRLLQQVASRLEATVRSGDTVARLGGDEFTLLLPGISTSEGALRVAEKILAVIEEPFLLQDQEIHSSASIGVAVLSNGESADVLLNNADTAMYHAKELGRGACQVFSENMHVQLADRFALSNELRHALERGELYVDYQPILRLADNMIVGAEALMRWNHPERGPIDPAEFIPLAEESGMIVTLGEWILGEATRTAQTWMNPDGVDVRVCVNLSPRQLLSGRLVQSITGALERTGLPASLLELEVTENVAMIRGTGVTRAFQELSDLGVSIAIDDFGMGYSSLDYLRRYPIGTLKIDKSFVGEVEFDNHSRAIAKTVVVLARTLGLNVVGEGVETQHQLEFLFDCGCTEAQGFLLGMPMSAEEIGPLVTAQAKAAQLEAVRDALRATSS
jgi:diguanylate cyclase (GGDEF)-like protein/PAS domain S-box-containing protein